MKLGLVLDEIFMTHPVPAGHPERPDRIRVLLDLQTLNDPRVMRVPPVEAEDAHLLAVHTAEHVARIRETEGRDYTMLDPDTHAGRETSRVARTAAGSAVRLVELIARGEIQIGFLAARPPGHHAETHRAMGFCFFNTVAVAAQYARSSGLAERVAIVDFDVHHGNGTQEIFWRRPDVFFVSLHQYPFYPGTGSAEERGEGPGAGTTLNLPLPAGTGDDTYRRLFEDRVIPALEAFRPELLLISAGFDAHADDPLGGMRLSAAAFREMTRRLLGLAEKTCGGRAVFVLEGGYDLEALRECVETTLSTCLS